MCVCVCVYVFVSINVQHDATIYSLFIFLNCSTYFGWYLHPSSGAHITVSAVSGINETVTATVMNVTGLKPVSIQSRSRQ